VAISWCKKRVLFFYEKASRLSLYAFIGSGRVVVNGLLGKLGLADGPRRRSVEFRTERHERFEQPVLTPARRRSGPNRRNEGIRVADLEVQSPSRAITLWETIQANNAEATAF
jgi:hypothetical protein